MGNHCCGKDKQDQGDFNLLPSEDEKHEAVVKIQACWRGSKVRKDHKTVKSSQKEDDFS